MSVPVDPGSEPAFAANQDRKVPIDDVDALNASTYVKIYDKITAKSDEIRKTYSESFIYKDGDIEQLYYKIIQTLRQYNFCSLNCSISVFHEDGRQEQFKDLESFKRYDRSIASPTERIQVEVNFSIVPPNTADLQNYRILITVLSKEVMLNKIKRSMPSRVPRSFFRMFDLPVGAVEVKYSDYIVAHSLLNSINSWFLSLDVEKSSKAFLFFQNHSYLFPLLSKYSFLLSSAYLVSSLAERYTLYSGDIFMKIVSFAIVSGISLFLSYRIGLQLGTWVERRIDEVGPPSLISLNQGDKRAHRQIAQENKSNILEAILIIAAHLLGDYRVDIPKHII